MKRFIALLIILLFAPAVFGSYIMMSVTTTSKIIFDNSGEILIEINQKGDEAAYKVEAIPMASDDFTVKGRMYADRLDPGKILNGIFNASVNNGIMRGTYPFVVKTVYHDANMYPFSVISSHSLTYKKSLDSSIKCSMSTIEIPVESSSINLMKIRYIILISPKLM